MKKTVKAWLYYPSKKRKMMATPRKYTAKCWVDLDNEIKRNNKAIVLPCTITFDIPKRKGKK